ncbi:MAG: DUF302 domain-containing protein [Magnetococcales bacterium]|nr:DUF302 domain-containing protein [Magnetococcales bacterium]
METASHYAIVVPVHTSFDATVEALRVSLAAQGFGILCEIDVSATLKKKLDVEHPRTLILGACNPPLALRALTAVPDIATLLPCNVVVRMQGDRVEIATINPAAMAQMIQHPEIDAVAQEVDKRLRAALDAVAAP